MSEKENTLVQIDRIYAGIPSVPCLAGCADCCGPVLMTAAEWHRIRTHIGHEPEGDRKIYLAHRPESPHCSLLDLKTMRCTVYEIRPLVCRLMGTGPQGLVCEHGVCSSTRMTDKQASNKMQEMFRVGSVSNIGYER